MEEGRVVLNSGRRVNSPKSESTHTADRRSKAKADFSELKNSADHRNSSVSVFPNKLSSNINFDDLEVEDAPIKSDSVLGFNLARAHTSEIIDTQPMPTISDSMLADVLREGSVATAGRLFSGLPEHFASVSSVRLVEAKDSTEKVVVLKQRFELVSLLGVGGMGTVYKALDRRRDEAGEKNPYVAIKLINDDLRSNPDAVACLNQETRKTQKLSHPNIVNVYDFDCDDDMFFMVMELMEGLPAGKILKKQPCGLGSETADAMIKDISNALICSHRNQVIHSDLKPNNIFVTEKGKTKLFDFGNACNLLNTNELNGLSSLTPAYASYEMLTGARPSVSDDVYALACVAYELLTGVHPFGKMPADLAFKRDLKITSIEGLSRKKMKAIEKALAFKKENRTQTVEEFYQQYFSQTFSATPYIYCAAASALTALICFILSNI